MPTSSLIRNIPSHVLYTLELKSVGHNTEPNIRPRVILKATLTEMAKKLGVRFDESEENNLFDLSNKLGNINGQYSWGGIHFQKSAKNLDIVPLPCGARLLQADLQGIDGRSNNKMPFSLDEYIGLVGYSHPLMNETYYKLGLKLPAIKEASIMRTLVLCFDGTSNHFSNRNTNVVKLVELLKNDDPERQMVYYQTGVGTYVSPGWMTSVGEKAAKKADEAVAWYLYQHVIDGYKYLMQTYRAGDRICIFGFSRGAYIARAVAGMVHAVGLLPRHNVEHIPYAYRLYERGTHDKYPNNYGALSTSRDDEDLKITAENYKATFCIPVKIDFVGVWDTVASMESILLHLLALLARTASPMKLVSRFSELGVLWRGVREGEFPMIEDSRGGTVRWLNKGRLAMEPGLKNPTGLRAALRIWWSFSSRSKSLAYATSMVAVGASVMPTFCSRFHVLDRECFRL
ncbi:hypothetical protein BDV93DRAFT_585819 [Ceratobasidium sp. AG-I]|nr:hypothetical protein BDV93DRAFT_585819 [Ceratobasidium sp. AG-I]